MKQVVPAGKEIDSIRNQLCNSDFVSKIRMLSYPSLLLNLNTTSRHVKFPRVVGLVFCYWEEAQRNYERKSFNCEKMECKIILATNQ